MTLSQKVCLKLPVSQSAEDGTGSCPGLQVLVLHMDIYSCGVCGSQSTDIETHLLHKSYHSISELHQCELCKISFACQKALLDHYTSYHNLLSILESDHRVLETEPLNGDQPRVVIISPPDPPPPLASKDAASVAEAVRKKAQDKTTKIPRVTVGTTTNVAAMSRSTSTKTAASSVFQSTYRRKSLLKNIKTCGFSSRSGFPGQSMTTQSWSHTRTTGSRRPLVLQRVRKTPQKNRPETTTATSPWSESVSQCLTEEKCQEIIQEIEELPPTEPEEVLTTHMPDTEVIHVESELVIQEPVEEEEESRIECTKQEKLHCLHCDYFSPNKEELALHMKINHKHNRDLHDSLSLTDTRCNFKDVTAGDSQPSPRKKPRKTTCVPRKVERQDMPGVYPCTQCGKSFNRMRYLRKHSHVHRNDKQFTCEECGKLFKCKGYLHMHMKTHQKNEKMFQCNQCDFTSCINAAIHAHRQIHSQGSVLCDICGYAYTDKATLAKHKRVHDPNRPFACNFPGCTWRFKTEIMCKAHIRAHTTEGKFQCAYCGYVFRHKHHLQRHETNMHGIRLTKHSKLKGERAASTLSQYIRDHLQNTEHTEQLELEAAELPEEYLVIEPLEVQKDSGNYEATDTAGLYHLIPIPQTIPP